MEAWRKARGNRDKDSRDCCSIGRLERFASFYNKTFRFRSLYLMKKVEGHYYFEDEDVEKEEELFTFPPLD